jgi:hypothetical protein
VALAAGAVEQKDVILAIFGVSAGLAGLVLVFLGLVVSTYQSFDRPTPKVVLARYQRVAGFTLGAFVLGMASVILDALWLLKLGHSQGLYLATAWVFGAQVVALLAATGWTIRQLVWRS